MRRTGERRRGGEEKKSRGEGKRWGGENEMEVRGGEDEDRK